jgi:hypothetical protein
MKGGLDGSSLMRVGLAVFVSTLTMITTSGCATIMNRGPREIPIASQPAGAKVSIYNRANQLVTTETTPFVAQLTPKHRFFVGNRYRVRFEMEGYEPAEVTLKPRIGAWYFSNFVFGGVVGFLIVDPATGAMFRLLPEEVDQVLTPLPSTPTPAPTPAPAAE